VDWNNNYADDDDKCVLFHCGNWAKSFLPEIKISNAPILGSTLGIENTYGALDGRAAAGPLTFGRVTTADTEGAIRAYVGEGELTDDKLDTFGNRAVARIPNLQKLMHHICRKGFEHHVAHDGRFIARNDADMFIWPRRSVWLELFEHRLGDRVLIYIRQPPGALVVNVFRVEARPFRRILPANCGSSFTRSNRAFKFSSRIPIMGCNCSKNCTSPRARFIGLPQS
jgi:hypothetical protein